jgi:hypothetical protein
MNSNCQDKSGQLRNELELQGQIRSVGDEFELPEQITLVA